MKKRIALLLLAAVMLMLAACGQKAAPVPTTVATEPETQATETQATQPVTPLEYAGVYRYLWRDEVGGTVVEKYSYIVLNADHTGHWIGQGVTSLTWDEGQLKTSVGQVCDIVLTREKGAVKLVVYESKNASGVWVPSAYEKINKLPAEMEAMIAEDTMRQREAVREVDYTGTYCRTWNEEIGGNYVKRTAYYVLNADHTGYVITQAVGKVTWNKNQVTDNFGMSYNISVTQENGNVNLLVYEFQGSPTVYQKIDRLPADMAALIAEETSPRPRVSAPEITKNPTAETVTENGTAYFVARANNYNTINWYIVSADRTTNLPVSNAPWSFPGLIVTGERTETLQLSNIPLTLNGWSVEAVFNGEGGSATTSQCFLRVNKAPKVQITALPSGGIYAEDKPVQLSAASGSTIFYELYDDVGNKSTGTVQSGGYVYVPLIPNCRYIARLVAYVVGDENNLIVCEYTMDGIVPDTQPASPSGFDGGGYTNNEATVTLTPSGSDSFYANVNILRLCNMDGSGSYSNGTVTMFLEDPSGNPMGASFNVGTGTLTITFSTWELLPQGTTFYGVY